MEKKVMTLRPRSKVIGNVGQSPITSSKKKKRIEREKEKYNTHKKNGHKKNGDNCLDFSPTSSVFLEAIIRRKNGVVIFPRKATLPCPLQPLPAVLTENKSMGMQMRCEQFFFPFLPSSCQFYLVSQE